MTSTGHNQFLKGAFDEYLKTLELDRPALNVPLFPYEEINYKALGWRLFGDQLVADELREQINNVNAWSQSLRRWAAWNEVCSKHEFDVKWDLENEFSVPLATFCLFQPSAVRDSLTLVVTNGVHQARLATEKDYRDRLPLDPLPSAPIKHATRRQKEKQLSAVLGRISNGADLLKKIRQLDDIDTRRVTFDFRNRASHAIAPRFSYGHTRAIVREVVAATEMMETVAGAWEIKDIPEKMVVRYGIGGTPPLDMEDARAQNHAQFTVAFDCLRNYVDLLNLLTSKSQPARTMSDETSATNGFKLDVPTPKT